MAADVQREEPSENDSCSVFSESILSQFSDSSLDHEYQSEGIPSHSIVYQQMRDVLQLQRTVAEQHIRVNAETLNNSERSLNSTIESQKNTIKHLELSLENSYVPKQDFLEIKEKLKEEQAKHKETLVYLTATLDKLDSTQKKAAELSMKIEQDKAAFEKCCDNLQKDQERLKSENRDLNALIAGKTQMYEDLQIQNLNLTKEINQLNDHHIEQKFKFKHHVTESEVQRQQEAYLKRMENEDGRKSRRKK